MVFWHLRLLIELVILEACKLRTMISCFPCHYHILATVDLQYLAAHQPLLPSNATRRTLCLARRRGTAPHPQGRPTGQHGVQYKQVPPLSGWLLPLPPKTDFPGHRVNSHLGRSNTAAFCILHPTLVPPSCVACQGQKHEQVQLLMGYLPGAAEPRGIPKGTMTHETSGGSQVASPSCQAAFSPQSHGSKD